MIFRWLFGGIILVSLAFFIPARSVDLWPSLNAGGIAALLFMIAMLGYILRAPIPISHRIVIGVATFLSVAALGAHWMGMLNTTQWQQNRLLSIKAAIVRGTMTSDAPIRLLSVLEDYYAQPKPKKRSLAKVFLQKYPEAKVGSNIYESSVGEDSMRVFVTTLSDSIVVLTGSHAYAKGRADDFVPYWGRKGALQERYILTEKGVRHESDN